MESRAVHLMGDDLVGGNLDETMHGFLSGVAHNSESTCPES